MLGVLRGLQRSTEVSSEAPACPLTPSQGRTRLERQRSGAEMKLLQGASTRRGSVESVFCFISK